MKPERIQVRIGETHEWAVAPAAIERQWPCDSFLDAARLARVAHNSLLDSPVNKDITTHEKGVIIRLSLRSPHFAEALFDARDQLDEAVGDAGF